MISSLQDSAPEAQERLGLSTAGIRGGAGELGYAATNGGATALTRGLAAELGGTGVRVNGVMLTWAENAFDGNDPEHLAWLPGFPLGRVTKLEEVAHVVAFLASDRASGITRGPLSPLTQGLCVCDDALRCHPRAVLTGSH